MQYPWLLIPQKEKQFVYSVSENRFHTTNIPELRNKYVLGFAFGWLVLVDMNTDDCSLWHPVSLDIIELPELPWPWPLAFNKCILSKPPIEPDCHILFIASDSMSHTFCQIGDDQFVTQSSTDNDEKMCLSAVASFQGKIYGIVNSLNWYWFRFVTIDFVDGTLELNPILMEGGQPWDMPHPLRSWAMGHANYLIATSCGELLLVHRMCSNLYLRDDLDFRVFRVDVNRMECKELENIGEQAIFVSECGDAFCCSSLGIKPNSIYYTLINSRNLFIYDLNDRSTTVSLPCSIAGRYESASNWVPTQIFRNFLN